MGEMSEGGQKVKLPVISFLSSQEQLRTEAVLTQTYTESLIIVYLPLSCTENSYKPIRERQTAKQINKQEDFPEQDYDLVHKHLNVLSPLASFSDGSAGEESAGNARGPGDVGLIFGLERSPGEGHGHPLQYSFLGNPMNKGAQRATVHRVWTCPSNRAPQSSKKYRVIVQVTIIITLKTDNRKSL